MRCPGEPGGIIGRGAYAEVIELDGDTVAKAFLWDPSALQLIPASPDKSALIALRPV